MYKPEDKGFLEAGGTVLAVAGGAVVGFFIGGPVGAVVGAGIGAGGAALAVDAEEINPFSRCEQCEGKGGIMLLDSSKSFKTQLKFVADGEAIETPICTQLVN